MGAAASISHEWWKHSRRLSVFLQLKMPADHFIRFMGIMWQSLPWSVYSTRLPTHKPHFVYEHTASMLHHWCVRIKGGRHYDRTFSAWVLLRKSPTLSPQ